MFVIFNQEQDGIDKVAGNRQEPACKSLSYLGGFESPFDLACQLNSSLWLWSKKFFILLNHDFSKRHLLGLICFFSWSVRQTVCSVAQSLKQKDFLTYTCLRVLNSGAQLSDSLDGIKFNYSLDCVILQT